MVIFLLFIIACAVAPEAIINICRFLEWTLRVVGYVITTVACVGFFGYIIYTTCQRIFA